MMLPAGFGGMVLPDRILYILGRLEDAGFEAYVVGGCVRDALAGRAVHDYDICTAARPDEVRSALAGCDIRDTGLKHGTVTLVLDHEPFEITTFRVDGTYSDGRRPDSVTFTDSVTRDLARRDFTVNAMAYHPARGLVDPFGGADDLRAGIIRCVGEPAERFGEDALRILRGMRFASRFGFRVEEKTALAMHALRQSLSNVAAERVRAELEGTLIGGGAADVLREYTDVLTVVIPEIAPCVGFDQLNPVHPYDVWEHTLHAVDAIDPEPVLRWTMLLHDLGKPPCFSPEGAGLRGHFLGHGLVSARMADVICGRLRFPRALTGEIHALIERHDTAVGKEDADVRRLLRDIGVTQARRLVKVYIADIAAQSPDWAEPRLSRMRSLGRRVDEIAARGDCFELGTLAVDGGDLIAIGVPPGPAVGQTLRALLERVIDEPALNDRDTLLALAGEKP